MRHRMKRMRQLLTFCCMMLFLAFGASQALGHGGGETMGEMGKDDACKLQRGHYALHFTAYQQKYGAEEVVKLHEAGSVRVKQEFQTYCEGVPNTGKLSITFDLLNEEMRGLPLSVRIIEAGEHGHDVLSLPSAVYRDGTVRIETEVDHAGRYEAIVTLDKVGPGIAHQPHSANEIAELDLVSHSHGNDPTEAELHAVDPTFRFPFTVGMKMEKGLPSSFSSRGVQAAGMLLGISALVVGARYYMNGKRKK